MGLRDGAARKRPTRWRGQADRAGGGGEVEAGGVGVPTRTAAFVFHDQGSGGSRSRNRAAISGARGSLRWRLRISGACHHTIATLKAIYLPEACWRNILGNSGDSRERRI